MRLGLSTLFCFNEPLRNALQRINRMGVEHVEIVDEWPYDLDERKVEAINRAIGGSNIRLSIHAPFIDINIAYISPYIRRAAIKRLKRSLRASAKLKPEYWVFHPGMKSVISDAFPGLSWRINLESVREILMEAKRHNLRIAIENGPVTSQFLLKRIEDFKKFYDDLGEDGSYIGITLDVGHAITNNQLYEMIKALHNKIVHTHLHDNDGREDLHLGIGSGKIDWPRLIRSLKEIGYNGALVIESITNVEESIRVLRDLIGR